MLACVSEVEPTRTRRGCNPVTQCLLLRRRLRARLRSQRSPLKNMRPGIFLRPYFNFIGGEEDAQGQGSQFGSIREVVRIAAGNRDSGLARPSQCRGGKVA